MASCSAGSPSELVQNTQTRDHDYFTANAPPASRHVYQHLVQDFLAEQSKAERKVVLITSGGTTVPLENQTVRFIDNFSAGTRGATSAEHFLDAGYAVIFLHRQFSLLPYSRHYSHSTNCFLDFIKEDASGSLVVDTDYQRHMRKVFRRYCFAKQHGLLLLLDFNDVSDYLWKLRDTALLMRTLGHSALFYLAAAVSDFFIPKDRLSEHKIQSGQTGGSADKPPTAAKLSATASATKLMINLDPVPKFLKSLVDGWAPQGMIVSFKLETDPEILILKAQQALANYCHHLVIGNLLSTRKREVVLITSNEPEGRWIRLPDGLPQRDTEGPEKASSEGVLRHDRPEESAEIESLIIPEVVRLHAGFIDKAEELCTTRS